MIDEQARKVGIATSFHTAASAAAPSGQHPAPVSRDLPSLLKEQYGRLLDAIPDGVVVADEAGHIQFANTRTASLFGYQRDELLGRSVEWLMPERFRPVHPGHRSDYTANPHVRPMGSDLQLFGLRRDATEFPVEISLSPIEIAGARLVLATIRDVTARTQVEQQLRRAEREAASRAIELDAILETQTDVVALVRPGGSVARINSSGTRLLGLATVDDAQALQAQSLPRRGAGAQFAFYDEQGHRLRPEELPTHRVLQGETLAGASAMRLLLRRPGAPEVHLEVVGAPVRGPGGVVTGGVVTFRDITQRIRLERRTHEALSALLAMAEAVVMAPELADIITTPTPPSVSATPLAEEVAGSSTTDVISEQAPAGINAGAYQLAALTRVLLDCRHVAIAAWDTSATDTPRVARPVALSGYRHHDTREWQNWLRWYYRRMSAPHAPDMSSDAVRIIGRLIAGARVRVNLTPPSAGSRKRSYTFGHSLLVPMHIAGRFVGCVAIDFGDQESRLALGEEDMALVQAVARLAALVTERDRLLADHQAREEAEARLAMLHTVLDELPPAVYLVRGRDAELVLSNRQVKEIWGAEWREGQPMLAFLADSGTRLFDQHNREMGPDQLATLHALRTGESVRQQQEVIRRPDGSSLAVLVNAIALEPDTLPYVSGSYDPQRPPEPLALVVLQDVSALKEAEQLKDEFIALAAHELRNPVASLAGYAQLLVPPSRTASGRQGRGRGRLAVPLEWQAEAVDAILQASSRLATLTDDLLDATRLHANRLTLRPEPTELGALVRRVAKRAQVTTKRHTITVDAPSAPVIVEVDAQRVEQVLTNLLSNAIKYSPQSDAVAITVGVVPACPPADREDADAAERALAGEAARVSVRDRGIGIPVSEQAQIFRRFARAANAREHGIPGTGLGLYLCRELIERQSGRIWFESAEGAEGAEGAGTTFTFELPLWHEPQ